MTEEKEIELQKTLNEAKSIQHAMDWCKHELDVIDHYRKEETKRLMWEKDHPDQKDIYDKPLPKFKPFHYISVTSFSESQVKFSTYGPTGSKLAKSIVDFYETELKRELAAYQEDYKNL